MGFVNEAHFDGAFANGGKEAIKITAAVAQTIAVLGKSDPRNENQVKVKAALKGRAQGIRLQNAKIAGD